MSFLNNCLFLVLLLSYFNYSYLIVVAFSWKGFFKSEYLTAYFRLTLLFYIFYYFSFVLVFITIYSVAWFLNFFGTVLSLTNFTSWLYYLYNDFLVIIISVTLSLIFWFILFLVALILFRGFFIKSQFIALGIYFFFFFF